jgi:hypothetical protein
VGLSVSEKKHLLRSVENKVGFKVDSMREAYRLANVLASDRMLLSGHTVARVWGLLSQTQKHYNSTLEVLCRFLGHPNLEAFKHQFEAIQRNDLNILPHNSLDLQLHKLDLAVAYQDYNTIFELLHMYHGAYWDYNYTIASMMGRRIRLMQKPWELLSKLAEDPCGRAFFYECFVDEDNPGGYYSKAIDQFYLDHADGPAKKLFALSYLGAKAAYSGKPFRDLSRLNLGKRLSEHDVEHFHERSRQMELWALTHLEKTSTKQQVHGYLDRLIEGLESYTGWERAWVIYRSTRPLCHLGLHKHLWSHRPYCVQICSEVEDISFKVHSVAQCFLQLLYIQNPMSDPNIRINLVTPTAFENEATTVSLVNEVLASLTLQQKIPFRIGTKHLKQHGHLWMAPFLRNL